MTKSEISRIKKQIRNQIDKEQKLSRGALYKIGRNSNDKKLWNLLSSYGDFIYYLSGARTTQSEGVLPQENLIDYSLGDLVGWKTSSL